MIPSQKTTKNNMADLGSVAGLVASLVQSMLSLAFNFGGIVAGTILVLHSSIFLSTPWALMLFPGILSVRGAIGGLFCGRLSTGLHLGTVRASYTKNTRDFYLLFYSVITLALVSSIMMSLTASLFGVFLLKITVMDSISMLAIVTATMGLSLMAISPITMAVSILSFKHGLDPDIITYPVMSTIADVLVTLCYVITLSIFFLLGPLGCYVIWILDGIFVFIVAYVLVKNGREAEFTKTIKEFFLVLIAVSFIVNVTGSILGKVDEAISARAKLETYTVYPAMIDTVGDVGAIVGSTATTKLALGTIETSFSSIKQHLTEIGGAWMASLIMFTLYSIISSVMHGMFALDELLRFTAQLLATNILAVAVIVVIAYSMAIFTYRRGWDPDNFLIPIESSLADTMTTLSLLIALSLTA